MLAALGAISRIEPRPYPEGVEPVAFHESYESDAREVRAFCAERRAFAHDPERVLDKWDVVIYLRREHYLFYLPSILLTALLFPDDPLGKELYVDRRLRGEPDPLTKAEREALERVLDVLALHGVTEGTVQREIERSRRRREWRARKGYAEGPESETDGDPGDG